MRRAMCLEPALNHLGEMGNDFRGSQGLRGLLDQRLRATARERARDCGLDIANQSSAPI